MRILAFDIYQSLQGNSTTPKLNSSLIFRSQRRTFVQRLFHHVSRLNQLGTALGQLNSFVAIRRAISSFAGEWLPNTSLEVWNEVVL